MKPWPPSADSYMQRDLPLWSPLIRTSLDCWLWSSFEIKHVYSYHLQPSIWLRYIDDIFLVWSHSREELDTFIQHLNVAHPTLKFTANSHNKSMDFLDTTVKVDTDSGLYTTLYTNPMDTHTYLHYTSAHPPHQKKSRPYCQLVQVKRITKQSDYEINSEKSLNYYTLRGYPDSVIASARLNKSFYHW